MNWKETTRAFCLWVLICSAQLSTCCSQIKTWDFHPPKIAVQKQRRRCGSAKPAFWLWSNRDTKTNSHAICLLLKQLQNTFTHFIVEEKQKHSLMATSNSWITGCSYLLSALTTLLFVWRKISWVQTKPIQDVTVLEFPACEGSGREREICRPSLPLLWHPQDLEQQTLHFFIHSTLLESNGEIKNMEKAAIKHSGWVIYTNPDRSLQ